MPFFGQRSINTSGPSDGNPVHDDSHLCALKEREHQLKIMHINTQCMTSTFDSLLHMVNRYSLDIITMSETWLKENKLLLQHVTIPGYVHAFNNRDKKKGGGVGVYVKESIEFKRRTDIKRRYPAMEHLWLEIKGRNRHSNLLLGVVYRSGAIMTYSDWLDTFESLLSDLSISWHGMLLVTGDVNVDLFRPSECYVRKYMDVLESLNLTQLVTKATRTTLHSETLIDHMITDLPKQVSYCDVLPCPQIGDHEAPYVCMNIRVTRFTPRYKYIRDERNFDEHAFTNDIEQLPLSIVYSTSDPEMQLEMLNTLLRECIDRHAPLKRTKVTRPPSPWLKELDIQKLQQDCRNMRTEARKDKSDSIWNSFREKRNQLKAMIGKAKRNFYYKALSSVKAKDVWRVIHRILHPNPQPLRFDPDELNTHFASTAERVTGATPTSANNISDLIQSLPEDPVWAFTLKPVSCLQVLAALKKLRSDCSCGPDGIPVTFIKHAADHLASPLTHILNTCILQEYFPSAWKVARISPIPKQSDVKDRNDLRPISILPVLSEVYERLVLGQMSDFVSSGPDSILKDTVSAYRKGHSTTTSLLAIKDDITKAMKRGEVTLAVLADFSKAFDTVAYEVVLKKLHHLGFSKSFLMWATSYLTGRKQFVQIDDKSSRLADGYFGVPQGSVLGPLLFNLYVNDLSEHLSLVTCHQYANDTTFYAYAKPCDISDCERRLHRLSIGCHLGRVSVTSL
ncbi:uncharacterized protein LOC5519158 [Nematostella vectensis]|uniref:uncharacterized protein LOC5519158 n=1 Tax=Nematostella vectensis TaxID=45351 RepID=UPI0020776A8C|nr:uncharacterized protein LOC5519158 [Nematostella vectensis]